MGQKNPEEQADELLRESALAEGVSLRQLGIIDDRRQRTISSREYPMSVAFRGTKNRVGFPKSGDPDEEDE